MRNTEYENSVPNPNAPDRTRPLISFGIPAYNRPELLKETLRSILQQTLPLNYEVIVTDDGGRPETAAVVAQFPADRFFYHRNEPSLGPVRNWNEGLRRARGEWVMILHEDDTLYPWYFDLVEQHLRDGHRRRLHPGGYRPGAPSTRRAPVRGFRRGERISSTPFY